VLQANGFQARVDPTKKDSAVPPGHVAEQSPSGRASRGQVVTLYLSTGKGAAVPIPGQPLPPGVTPPTPPGRGGGGRGGGGGGGGGNN
jgi:beta-lactam-binding protein with PASTA domain